MRKLDPNESGSLDHFTSVRWYMDEEVSMDYSEEAELMVGWDCRVSMLDLQWEIYLNIRAPKR